MKSGVISCFDYKTLEVPEELTKWKIPDEEITAELSALAGDHAIEESVEDAVRDGDSVRCVCLEGSAERLSGRIVFLYPGRKLPGAEAAEMAVLGKKTGEQVETVLGKDNDTAILELTDIVRRKVLPAGDELVRSLELPGVSTVEDYFDWYREKNRKERRTRAGYRIIQFWLEQMLERSEYRIDEEEKREWSYARGKIYFEGMLAAGVDLRIPSEGFELLTDEQAITQAAAQQAERFKPFLLLQYLCRQDHYALTEEDYERELVVLAAEHGMDLETARKRSSFSMYQEVRYQEHVFGRKGEEAEKWLED